MDKIKVLIADDHRVVREGLAAILKTKEDINVVGEAQDGMEAVEKTKTLMPDVVLMDVSMPRMGGVEATRQIKREFPHIGIVALTMYEEQQYIFDLVRAGFGTRRKQLKNSLSANAGIDAERLTAAFDAAGIPQQARAQELDVADWLRLYRALRSG